MKTRINSVKKIFRTLLALTIVLLCSAKVSAVSEIFLRADSTVMTMPDGRLIEMWGFAQDSAFGAHDGTVTVPGPVLTIGPGESHLIITLENNLPEPVSLMIPGQIAPAAPASFTDDQGRQRIQSFTHETPVNNIDPVTYEWVNLRAGTFIYHSGSHPAVQVQMGLYGCLKKNYSNGPVRQAYEGVEFDDDLVLVFSEIDPALHDAVQADDYGPGKSITSTIDYEPKYFLINGQGFTSAQTPLSIGRVNDRVLLRLVNAGIKSHVPLLQYLRGQVVAEDGFAYTYSGDLCAIDLPPAKTKDVLIVPDAAGTYVVYDHALHLTNDTTLGGGMMVKLNVKPAVPTPFDATVDLTVSAATEISEPTLEIPQSRVGRRLTGRVALAGRVAAPGPIADLDKNGMVDLRDIALFIQYWHARDIQSGDNPVDLNDDGLVDAEDLNIMYDGVRNSDIKKSPIQSGRRK